MKPLTARQTEFKIRLWDEVGQTFAIYPKEMIQAFCDYWFEISYMGKKMRFEKERTFGIKRRLATWKNNSISWNKSPEKSETLPAYFNKKLWQSLSPEKIQIYKAHLSRLGWQYFTSQSGNHWLSPDNKRHWL